MSADVLTHNAASWNRQSTSGTSRWCVPVDVQTIEQARAGNWQVILTPNRPVPADWFPDLAGLRVLCLASGGGQQAPVLAAAGARVVSFDLSEEQLAKDMGVAAAVAAATGIPLELSCEQGNMADLSRFADGSFDLIFHPVSNVFAADVLPVWRECHRVLGNGGRLLSGFMNPDFYLFDHDDIETGGPLLVTRHLPYSDLHDLPADRLSARIGRQEALEFSHSLDAQIGGQIAAGFTIAGFYEDRWSDEASPLNRYMPTSMATLAIRG
ncbi:MAG: class I SAM-dependent methyltransferase [Pseudomonadales bacterium]|nr:class I SAM-dependent methyltransferase [Pseudomonadales bacterium]